MSAGRTGQASSSSEHRSRGSEPIATLSPAVSAKTERIRILLRERARLLKQVAQKKRVLARSQAEAQRARDVLSAKLEPLLVRRDEHDRELHAQFARLLAGARLPKLERNEVIAAYQRFQREGLLSPRPVPGRAGERGAPRESARSAEPAAVSAPKVTGAGKEHLRSLFKRLTVVFHPDRARSPGDQARRTEVMKELTRAYEAQDLARLMELEQLHEASAPLTAPGASEEDRLKRLSAAVSELRRQQRELSKLVRGVRDSGHSRIASALSSGELDPSFEELVRAVELELEALGALRAHVTGFVARRSSARQFVEGLRALGAVREAG